jgi:hypothetical protein
VLVAIASVLSTAGPAQAQQAPTSPKTQIEAFQSQTGQVVRQSVKATGTWISDELIKKRVMTALQNPAYEQLSVTAVQYATDLATVKGIVVNIIAYGPAPTAAPKMHSILGSRRLYVDEDEIDGLIHALDQFIADKGSTRAEYKTRGGLLVSTSTLGGSVAHAGDGVSGTAVFMDMPDLVRFRELIAAAGEAKLDSGK